MNAHRWRAAAIVTAALGLVGGCQLVSGLGSLHEATLGAGGATATASVGSSTTGSSATGSSATGSSTTGSSAGGAGGVMSSSTSSGVASSGGGMGGGVSVGMSSSTGTTSTTASASAGSSSGGCTMGSMTDKLNCGKCGHDCGGGACTNGVCQPYAAMVVSGTSPVTSLVALGGYVYVGVTGPGPSASPTGFIGKVSSDGNVQTFPFVKNVAPTQLAVDTNHLYWIDATTPGSAYPNAISRVLVGGSTTTTLTGEPTLPSQIYANNGLLFWSVPQPSMLYSLDTASITTKSLPLPAGARFAVDDNFVYYNDTAGIRQSTLPPGNGNPVLLATTNNVSNLAADTDPSNGYVYWTSSGAAGTVTRAFKSGGGVLKLADTTYTGDLLVDNANVYWVSFLNAATCQINDTSTINWTPLAGGGAKPLTFFSGCTVLAQDVGNLYWIEAGNTLWRLGKP